MQQTLSGDITSLPGPAVLRTEVEFTLPCGLVDEHGNLHRDGVMRRATAADEIAPLRDPRVVKNEAYLSIIVLSRVVTRLGGIESISPKTIESLYATDLAYLQRQYNELNRLDDEGTAVVCPECQHHFDPEDAPVGGVLGYPLDELQEEVAFVAYHFHWSHAEVMTLEHRDRRRWVQSISSINRSMNEE